MSHSCVVSLSGRRGWCSLPSDFKKSMKREVQMYRNSEMISLSLYSSPGNSSPLYQFTMKYGGNGNGTSTVFGPYENIKQDFSHEEWIVDKVAGVFNVGTPNFVRIGYGKKSKSKKVIEGFGDVDLDKRSLMRSPFKVGKSVI